ncbi:amidase family protein [Natrarchaeobius chitinivorans]|nr:amidase [Natrarchaeobius chitinivorans]
MRGKFDVDALSPPQGESHGHRSDDEYNALVYVYDEPRTESRDGELSGMTFAIKDSIAVRDLPMTCGLEDHAYVPSFDAPVVERLLDAGGTITGKANMYALGVGKVSELGRVRNAIDRNRVPGGSSSGSAVAVASGLVDASIGADAGGSVRIPAAFNGLVGMKPSPGTIPGYGSVSTMNTLGTKGPITRTVTACAHVFDAISGPDHRDPDSYGRNISIDVDTLDRERSFDVGLPQSFFAESDDDVRDRVTDVARELERETDCEVVDVELDNELSFLPPYFSGPELTWIIKHHGVNYGGGAAFDPVSHHFLEKLQNDGFNKIITKKKLPHSYLDDQTEGKLYAAAKRMMMEYRREVEGVFEDVDLLLSPTTPMLPPEVAPDLDDEPSTSGNTRPFNLAGTPAVTVPVGRVDGLPVGAQIAAPAYEDERALAGARMIERLRR